MRPRRPALDLEAMRSAVTSPANFHGTDQTSPGRGIDSRFRAGRRPQTSPGSPHAVLQSHSHAGRGGGMQRRIPGREKPARSVLLGYCCGSWPWSLASAWNWKNSSGRRTRHPCGNCTQTRLWPCWKIASALSEKAGLAMADASAQGNHGGAETIKISLQRLRQRSELMVTTLTESESETQRA